PTLDQLLLDTGTKCRESGAVVECQFLRVCWHLSCIGHNIGDPPTKAGPSAQTFKGVVRAGGGRGRDENETGGGNLMAFYDYAVAVMLWGSMIAYAILGGADFGGGIWNILFFGRNTQKARSLISGAVGPVWEANNVWLIYIVVGLYTGF